MQILSFADPDEKARAHILRVHDKSITLWELYKYMESDLEELFNTIMNPQPAASGAGAAADHGAASGAGAAADHGAASANSPTSNSETSDSGDAAMGDAGSESSFD